MRKHYIILLLIKKLHYILILLPILPKIIYMLQYSNFYTNRIAKKIKLDLLQMLECKSLLILITLIIELKTIPFKHLMMVNTLSLEF